MLYGLYKGKKLIEIFSSKESLSWFRVGNKILLFNSDWFKDQGYRISKVKISEE